MDTFAYYYRHKSVPGKWAEIERVRDTYCFWRRAFSKSSFFFNFFSCFFLFFASFLRYLQIYIYIKKDVMSFRLGPHRAEHDDDG